jgi:hypothetical protein
VENKTACFVGSGLAALAGAAFLIRDGQMPGGPITILEQQQLPGGALDGIKEPQRGFVIRGGRDKRYQSSRIHIQRIHIQLAFPSRGGQAIRMARPLRFQYPGAVYHPPSPKATEGQV